MNEFMIGVNYWDSKSGTDMWRNFDADVIDKDLRALADIGVKYLRVFPNWRDFQPVKKLYGHCGSGVEYVLSEEELSLDDNINGIDERMVENFRIFAKTADNYGMKLMVSLVTGWMSGRLFCPPALEGKNLITDPEAIMFTNKYIKGLVSAIKDIDNIVVWDLGNECNNLAIVKNRFEAYAWTAFVSNTIRSIDSSRPIASGMHGLSVSGGNWSIQDQAELCDYMTTHPYPSPSISADIEPYNRMRATIFPTAQSLLYSNVSGKPCIIQEQGVFSEMLGNRDMAADFVRVNMFSAWANNLSGYFYWCGMEHTLLDKAPYTWITMERQLGILDVNRNPKPAAIAMKHVEGVLSKLPKLSKKQTDAICILSDEINKPLVAMSTYVLCMQAGFQIVMQDCNHPIGISDVYIMPAICGWKLVLKKTLDFLLDRVKNHGAKLLVTFHNGSFIDMEEIFGVRSLGIRRSRCMRKAHLKTGVINYFAENELFLESAGAEVLAWNDAGNIIFSRNRYGKGHIYLLGFSPELMAVNATDGYDHEITQAYSNVYREFGEDLVEKYILQTENPYIGVTQSYAENGDMYLTAINYSDKAQKPKFMVEEGWEIEVCYGNVEEIPPCDALIVSLRRKGE